MESAEFVFLDDNSLSQPVPTELGLLRNLSAFGLQNNSFTATIPTQLCLLSNVASFNVRGNRLNGTLPVSLPLCIIHDFLSFSCTVVALRLHLAHLINPIYQSINHTVAAGILEQRKSIRRWKQFDDGRRADGAGATGE